MKYINHIEKGFDNYCLEPFVIINKRYLLYESVIYDMIDAGYIPKYVFEYRDNYNW